MIEPLKITPSNTNNGVLPALIGFVPLIEKPGTPPAVFASPTFKPAIVPLTFHNIITGNILIGFQICLYNGACNSLFFLRTIAHYHYFLLAGCSIVSKIFISCWVPIFISCGSIPT